VARMHPQSIVFAESGAERQVFEALERALPNTCDVLHHVSWVQRVSGRSRDGESDFVIVDPDRGILVLEVKGGVVRYDANTGSWSTGSSDGPRTVIGDPFQQATNGKWNLRRWLEELPDWNKAWGPFGHAVAFPSGLLTGGALPQTDPGLLIDAEDFQNNARLKQKLDGALQLWADGSRLGEAGAARVVQALAHDIEIRQPLGMAVDEADREILQLSDSQLGILRLLSATRRVAISGPAGSGKTLLAAEKARRLAADGFRTLFTCFNRPLADYLRGSLAGNERLEVLSFHQLCRQLAVEAHLPLPPQPWSQSQWDQVVGLLEPAASKLGPRYDGLVIDEGQDFSDDWWLPLLTLLHEPDNGILYVFYDSNQAIYRRPGGLPEGLVTVPLWENWRNTRPIFDAVMRFFEGERIECRGPAGPAVEWHKVATRDLRRELGIVLQKLIVDGRLGARELVVLTPKTVDRSACGGRCGNFMLTPTPRGQTDVLLSSIYRFKGLDAKAVIVCEVSGPEDASFVQLMYVACSRARSLLVVMETLSA